MVRIEVSIGEALDKISILKIKKEKFTGKKKENVVSELEMLEYFCEKYLDARPREFFQLEHINRKLWAVEDKIRQHEALEIFNDEFIKLARSVYHLNDERSRLKKALNIKFNSELIEEKQWGQ